MYVLQPLDLLVGFVGWAMTAVAHDIMIVMATSAAEGWKGFMLADGWSCIPMKMR